MPNFHVPLERQRASILYVIVCEVKTITPKCVYVGAGKMMSGREVCVWKIGFRTGVMAQKKPASVNVCGLF